MLFLCKPQTWPQKHDQTTAVYAYEFDKIYFYPTIFNEFCIVVLQICMIYLGHRGLKFVKNEKREFVKLFGRYDLSSSHSS